MLMLRDVTKIFPGPVPALQGVTLTMHNGVFGLLGPNGAGKTTLMQIIAGLLEPTSGEVLLDGADIAREPQRMWAHLGYLPQDLGFYEELTGEQMLTYLLRLKGVERRRAADSVGELLALVNLSSHARRTVRTYSGGMRRRLGLAQAIAADPRVVILDEPTAGLDPEERQRFHQLLVRVARERIVILSTHIVEDVAALCTRFAVLAKGRVVFEGTPSAARDALRGRICQGAIRDGDSLPAHVLPIRELLHEGELHARVLVVHGPEPEGFTKVAATLEDAYFLASRAISGLATEGEAAA